MSRRWTVEWGQAFGRRRVAGRAACWLAMMGLAFGVRAHEFWLMPDRFSPPEDAEVTLALRVGEQFVGEPVGFGRPVVERMRWFSQGGVVDLTERLPIHPEHDSVVLAFERPGRQLIALDTRAFHATLAPDAFNAYLREEGLEHVLAQRQAVGHINRPGRERYRRHIKTLLAVGAGGGGGVSTPIGQTLEIVPLADPHALRPGDPLHLRVLFKDRPLKGALVKLWNHQGTQLQVLQSRTDGEGRTATALPVPGVWMASVVHMVPTSAEPDWDWDSHWGNMTFELKAP